MKTGLKELKKEFKNITWFERKDIKNEASLDKKDVEWLRGWTIAPLGVASIFYIFSGKRRLHDIATVHITTFLFFQVDDGFLRPMFINDMATEISEKYPHGFLLTVGYFLIALLFSVASLYSLYFLLRHGKRLSWNRGTWKNIQELRSSEKKWFWLNTIPTLALIVLGLLLPLVLNSNLTVAKFVSSPFVAMPIVLAILAVVYRVYLNESDKVDVKNVIKFFNTPIRRIGFDGKEIIDNSKKFSLLSGVLVIILGSVLIIGMALVYFILTT